jgi:hypothetical protein
MVEIPVMVTKAVVNIQEDKIVEATEVAEWAPDMAAAQSLDMAVDETNLQEKVDMVAAVLIGALLAEIGEPVAMRAVLIVDILKINIWEEVRADQAVTMMIMVVLEEAVPAWEEVAPVLQADEADAVVPGINFPKTFYKQISV